MNGLWLGYMGERLDGEHVTRSPLLLFVSHFCLLWVVFAKERIDSIERCRGVVVAGGDRVVRAPRHGGDAGRVGGGMEPGVAVRCSLCSPSPHGIGAARGMLDEIPRAARHRTV